MTKALYGFWFSALFACSSLAAPALNPIPVLNGQVNVTAPAVPSNSTSVGGEDVNLQSHGVYPYKPWPEPPWTNDIPFKVGAQRVYYRKYGSRGGGYSQSTVMSFLHVTIQDVISLPSSFDVGEHMKRCATETTYTHALCVSILSHSKQKKEWIINALLSYQRQTALHGPQAAVFEVDVDLHDGTTDFDTVAEIKLEGIFKDGPKSRYYNHSFMSDSAALI